MTTAAGFPARTALALVISTVLASCLVVMDGQGGQGDPIDPAVVGQVFDDPAGGPPIECRGIAEQFCVEPASRVVEDAFGVPRDEVQRVVVSCVAMCNAREGEYRIDIVLEDGATREVGGGGYGSSGPVP